MKSILVEFKEDKMKDDAKKEELMKTLKKK